MNKRSRLNNISYSALSKSTQQRLPYATSTAFPANSAHRSQKSSISHHKKKNKQGESFSDSLSSEASCLQKKIYRCCYRTHNKGVCGHPYQNYLAQLREKRLRRKPCILLKQRENSDQPQSLYSPQVVGSIPTFSARSSRLIKILEQAEQAEYSKSKPDYSISISVGRHLYFRKLKSKQQFLACITEIQRMIEGRA